MLENTVMSFADTLESWTLNVVSECWCLENSRLFSRTHILHLYNRHFMLIMFIYYFLLYFPIYYFLYPSPIVPLCFFCVIFSPFPLNPTPLQSFSNHCSAIFSFFLIRWGMVCEWGVNCLPSWFKTNSLCLPQRWQPNGLHTRQEGQRT